ncbi:MAG: NAD(P)-binding domain-containing protein, partial [Nitrospinota bacterium]
MTVLEKIKGKRANIGVIGLGYVGLPLLIEFVGAGFQVTGFDTDPAKVKSITAGKSYIKHIPSSRIKEVCKTGRLKATTDLGKLADMDAILICVPTPLNEHREPEMSYVFNSTR